MIVHEPVSNIVSGIVKPIIRADVPLTHFDITVQVTSTHIGFWGDRGIGDCSSADVKRLSITVSNGNMFFDSDPVETQTEINLRFATGDVRMSLSSGRFSSSSVPAEVRTYIESNAGNSIPVEIIR